MAKWARVLTVESEEHYCAECAEGLGFPRNVSRSDAVCWGWDCCACGAFARWAN